MSQQVGESHQFQEWRRFLLILLLIFSPLLVFITALEALVWRIGETMPMNMVATWQSDGPDRMWRGGDGRSYLTYKVARVRLLKPDVIALGASRANSFRAEAFAPYTFFNAGLTSWTFDHYRRFLELATNDSYAPKVLIFNFDYWMFSPGFEQYWVDRFYEQPATHLADLKIVVDQLVKTPITLLRRLPYADRLKGLYAVLSGDGFRADGSLFGQPGSPDPSRLLNDGTGIGVPPVALSDHLAPEQIKAFERFVAFAKEKHIALIGIQVPYYAKIVDGLDSSPKAGIWREFRSPEWHDRFVEQGVIFFDFGEMPEYRDKPEYFIDSLHPDARVVGQIVRTVLADPRVHAILPNVQGQE